MSVDHSGSYEEHKAAFDTSKLLEALGECTESPDHLHHPDVINYRFKCFWCGADLYEKAIEVGLWT
jgi:hypothetical protein